MKILSDGSFSPESYADQINEAVQGFISIWTKFDSMLPGEVSQIRSGLDGLHSGREPYADTNYEVFYRVSNSLSRKSSLTMGEVSSLLSVPLSTATRIVDWLVERGYTHRLSDRQDRRIVRVALTKSGQELHRNIESLIRVRVQQILSNLTPEERDTLFTLIRKVVSTVRAGDKKFK